MPTRYAIGVICGDISVMVSEACDDNLWWETSTYATREEADEGCKCFFTRDFKAFVIEFTYGEE